MAIRPGSRSLSVAQGKGLDLASAKASAVMESIESYHAERITLPLVLDRWADLELSARRVVDVDGLPRLAGTRVSEHSRLLWIEGTDLLDGAPTWVPYEVVHTDATLPGVPGSGSLVSTSNGLASGNHRDEAISHAICEVVERDATALWKAAGRDPSTRVDLDTIDDPACRALLARFDDAGFDVAVWDATSDVGLPVFVAGVVERAAGGWRPVYPMEGSGCHVERGVACARALTEAAQGRLTYIAGTRDDLTPAAYRHMRSDQVLARKRASVTGRGTRAFRDAPTSFAATVADDVEWQLECLRRVGIREVVVVDLTSPAFGIPVVRVVIPGLEFGEFAGIAPGPRSLARAGTHR